MPPDLYRKVVDVNLGGAFFTTQAAANQMVKQGRGGAIVAISSISALVGGAMQSHYTPTKAGVHSLMQSIAIALGPHGIRCNSVMPGAIETDINRDDWSDPKKRAYLDSRVPLGRFGKPEDIADVVVFFASDWPATSRARRCSSTAAFSSTFSEAAMRRDEIVDVRAYVVEARGAGGDYHDRDKGHWLIDTLIANPMSGYPEYKDSRTSWGIAVLGSLVVEIETRSGKVGVATGLGGPPACFMIEKHFRRFLVGADPRDINRIWDQIYRATMPYGRKGMTVAALSVVDLALWDLLGILRDEPVYALIGGATREAIALYCTGPRPDVSRRRASGAARCRCRMVPPTVRQG